MAYSIQDRKLLLEFANSSDQLLELGVISTDSFTGEIGEFYACQAYNLNKSNRVNQGFDAVCKLGNRYQVKAKISKGQFDYSISGLKKELFEFLVVVYCDKYYNLLKIVKIPVNKIESDNFRLSNTNIDQFEYYDLKKIKIPIAVINKIGHFAELYNQLIKQNIIRSRRIVGDIGEFYAADRLNLKLEENKNSKGLDAKDKNGISFEIKTRRVYDSDRRISQTRRINGLVGKSAEYLIVVTLDRKFSCSGMWIMPTKNILNPKSAKLQIVNNTLGVKNLVPSQIGYLQTGEKFVGSGNINKINKKKKAEKNIKEVVKNKSTRKNISHKQNKKKDFNFIDFTKNEKIGALITIILLILYILLFS